MPVSRSHPRQHEQRRRGSPNDGGGALNGGGDGGDHDDDHPDGEHDGRFGGRSRRRGSPSDGGDHGRRRAQGGCARDPFGGPRESPLGYSHAPTISSSAIVDPPAPLSTSHCHARKARQSMRIAQDQRHTMDGERTNSLSFYLICDFSSVPVSLTAVALLQERDELPIELCGGDQAAEAEVISFMHRVDRTFDPEFGRCDIVSPGPGSLKMILPVGRV